MAIIETRKPYEFLARWDESTGAFRGAHIQFFDAVERDGARIAGAPSKAYGVGDGLAFPLADIMSTITADALAHCDVQAAEILALKAKVADLEAQVSKLEADLGIKQAAEVNGVPQSITKRQGRAQLKLDGLLTATEGYVFSLPDDADLRMAYEDSSEWQRQNPGVIAMMAMLGKSVEQTDAFFIAASSL